MKQNLHIEADFDKPELLKDMVEKLVIRHNEKNNTPKRTDHEALDISSTEAYVCGSLSIDDEEGNKIKLAFDGSFLFSCIKGINGSYEVTWSSSLS